MSAWLNRDRLRAIAGGLAVGLVVSLTGAAAASVAVAVAPRRSAAVLDWRAAKIDVPTLPDCVGQPLSFCEVVSGPGKRMLLAGDSNARMWIPTFAAIARAYGMSLYVAAASACPWQRGLV